MKRVTLIFSIFVCAIIFTNCAKYRAQQRVREIEEELNPLMGKTKEEVVLALGVPTDISYIENLEIFQYYKSYGMRGAAIVSPGTSVGTVGTKTWEQYDCINVYFRDNIMIKWDCMVNR